MLAFQPEAFAADELLVLRRLVQWLESTLTGDKQGNPRAKLSQVITDCIAAKRMANCRQIYIAELQRYLSKFCEALADPPINEVTVQHLEHWLARPEWSPGTRATGINRLSALFSFAVRRGLIPSNPVDRIDRVKLERTPPQILSPSQAKDMLVLVRARMPSLLPYIVLALFAGVLAKYRDSAKVAEWLGNSQGVLHRHYKQLVNPDDSDKFWSIAPGEPLR